MKQDKIGYKDVIRNKQYLKMVIASVINRLGDSIDSIAFTWLVYMVTHSAVWSAIIFGVNRLPTVLLQPLAGAAVERRNKRLILVVTDLIRAVCVGFVATAYLFHFLNPWILLTCTIIISCAEAFNRPAASALVPKLLDKEHYSFGLSLNSSATSVAELIGYGVAGIIISTSSIATAIYIDMATFLISATIIFTVKVKKEVSLQVALKIKDYIHELKSGFAYLRTSIILRYFIVFAVFINGVLVPLNSLEAPLIREVLHTGGAMLSVLSLGISFGMVIGAGIYPYISNRLNSRILACLGGYSIGIYYFSFALVGNYIGKDYLKYIVIALVSFIVGFCISLLSTFVQVEFVKHIKEEYMARVYSIMGALSVAAMPVVSFVVSILAKWLPTIVIFLIAGIFDILICIVLCSKKKFNRILTYEADSNRKEVNNNEEERGDIEAC